MINRGRTHWRSKIQGKIHIPDSRAFEKAVDPAMTPIKKIDRQKTSEKEEDCGRPDWEAGQRPGESSCRGKKRFHQKGEPPHEGRKFQELSTHKTSHKRLNLLRTEGDRKGE